MIKLKKSFLYSLAFLPRSFNPESPEYLTKVGKITVGFGFVSVGVFGLVLIYLFLRFCCKKCVGPVKISQVTRLYRNITWILMISSLIALISVYSFLLTYSVKIK